MKYPAILLFLALAIALVPGALAVEHTIQWQNHCPYPVWVNVQGGEQTTITGIKSDKNPEGKNTTYGGCACMLDGALQKSIGCNPTTKCDGVACEGPNHEGNYFKCNTGKPLVDGGGFRLDADLMAGAQTMHTSTVPMNWQGAFWGRTHCTGTADDLDCDWMTCRVVSDGKGKLQCGGIGVTVPATKGEINFDENGVTTYDVSIVDGFNVPMQIEIAPNTGKKVPLDAKHAYFDCGTAGTKTDILPLFNATGLTTRLIKKTDAGEMAAIWSACSISSSPNPQDPRFEEYCCKGVYGSAQDYVKNGNHKCDPTTWPRDLNTAAFFHKYLVGSYSYAYDDDASTFQCKNADSNTGTSAIVTFCGANEPQRINLPGDDSHSHLPVIAPTLVPTPEPTTVITIAPTQTPVPHGPYNPTKTGDVNF